MTKVCRIVGCEKEIKGHSARGLCKKHYRKLLLYGDVEALDRRKMRKRNYCKVENCERTCNSHGFCRMHYSRLIKYGNPLFGHRKYMSSHRREHKTWESMRERCNNPKHPAFQHYGGRGVKVCERWNCGIDGFYNFLEDMGPRPDGYSLDRINSEEGYCPENCRWADDIMQQNNKRNNHLVTIKGITKTVTQWSRDFGVNPHTAFSRIRKGENGERIFRKPWEP